MPTVTCTSEVGPAGLAALRAPRQGLVAERSDGPDTFTVEAGPVSRWHRTLEVTEAGPDRHRVEERISFALAIPLWAPLFVIPIALLLRREHRALASADDTASGTGHIVQPFWAPADRFDARASTVLALACALTLVTGYVGTILTQTATYAASEFHRGTTAQGAVLASVRVGVLLALVITTAADRRGRRRLLLLALLGACLCTALGAAMPDLWTLGATQALAQGLSTAGALLIGVLVAEEVPAGSRAWAVSMLTMSGGLGAGMCVWVLPVADVGDAWWRIIYLVPLLGVGLIMWAGRHLPESHRFVDHRNDHRLVTTHETRIHQRRFWLLAAASFGLALFIAPMAQLQNDFLRHERHYSAAAITAYTLVTSTPAGLGILLGGWLADRRGRRMVAAVGVLGGASVAVSTLFAHSALLWGLSILGAIVGAIAIPAFGVYGPELFPTLLRGRTNGRLQVITVSGSSLGLLVAGWLTDRLGRFGLAMSVLLIGPLLVATLVIVAFPETSGRTLEELNPEDRA